MIISLICMAVFAVISLLTSILFFFIPNGLFSGSDLSTIVDLIKKSSVFVPTEMMVLLITSIVGWYIARLAWAVVEWIYKKIPGVN